MKYLFILIFSLTSAFAHAGEGIVRGKIFDGSTGETLVGVTVFAQGTTNGTTTDLDGNFTLKVDEGIYSLQISYLSYQTLVIENVEVKADETVVLDNIQLTESTHELSEVIVTAQALKTTETALQSIKKKSAVILDGISSAKMELTGDGTAVEAAKRITGISVEGGKYVYVRGLGDRYSKTTLNHVDVPGLDPDRNSLQMDIFPSNLIDNIMVSKNFTADMPADFTGGIMNIETKAFPERKIFSVSIGTSYNPQMHFNSDYLYYQGGSTDFLGFDDGTRDLPHGANQNNIPTPVSGHSDEDVRDFVQSFNPHLGTKQKTSLPDMSTSITFGNQLDLNTASNSKLGYIFSVSYKSEYRYFDEVINSEYQRYTDPDKNELRYAFIQEGEMGKRNILAGLLGGLAYKTRNTKLRLTAMHLQSGESRAGKFNLTDNGEAIGQSGYFAVSDNLEYNQRSLTNVLLNGVHRFNDSGWEIDWRISPTRSSSEDPDIRKTAFTHRSNDVIFSAGAGGNPSRIWRTLNELNATAKTDITKAYSFLGSKAKLKFGLSHNYKTRDYEILFFDMQFFGGQSWDDPKPDNVLNPDNIYPNRPNAVYYQSGNGNPNPNAYSSNANNTAAYISNEFYLLPQLKIIPGLRIENYVQRHTGRDQRYASGDTENGENLVNEKVLDSFDFFPSVNTIFHLNEHQNIRLSYSKTIARPSFKELSFAQILDPVSNRIFNGSLFSYPNWSGNLTETRIDNIDLRWELFLGRGELFSMSAFYKNFDKPIELVRIPEQQSSTEYQARNVGSGLLYGVEIELQKNLGFMANALRNISLSGNLTLVESQTEMTDTEYNSRKSFEKPGEITERTRQMAGQSPMVLNAGIHYGNYEAGWDAGLFYNVKGSTLSIVGMGLYPDIYEKPFQSLNFSLNKKIGQDQKTSVSFKASNLLNSKAESVFKSFMAEPELYHSINPGRSFSIGISYKF
jgi:TonB-dependent receptor